MSCHSVVRRRELLTVVGLLALLVVGNARLATAALVGYWPLDGNGTATVGTNGTLVNGPTAANDRYNAAGGALAFNQPGQTHVDVAGGGGLNNVATASVSMWVKWTGTQVGGIMLGSVLSRQSNGVFSNNIIGLNGANPNTAAVQWFLHGGASQIAGATPVGDNVWRNIAVTFTPGTGTNRLYMDGVLQASSNVTGTTNNNAGVPLSIGAWVGDGNGYSNSSIDDVGVFNTPLTLGEVRGIYNLSTNATLQYDLGEANQLFELHNAASGSVTIGDLTWTYVTGLGTNEGDLIQIGTAFFLQLTPEGTGVFAAPVPEPSTFALLCLGAIGLAIEARRRRAAA